jgi:hypothetical protein
MKKSLVMVSVFALVALTGCKKDNSVDNKAIIDALFSAGMSWNGQQKAAADERLKSTYPIYVSVDNYVYGTEGGYIHVTGSVSGSMTIDDYSYTVTGGSMFLGLTESIVEYTFESEGNVYTMNGAPYISLTGLLRSCRWNNFRNCFEHADWRGCPDYRSAC